MKKIMIAAVLAASAAPAFAEPACNPGEELKPVWESLKTFEEEGGEVVAFKINSGGCYEVYGEVEGVKMEIFYDPNTGEEIERIAS